MPRPAFAVMKTSLCRLLTAPIAVVLAAINARAALWESSQWTMSPSLAGQVGYDSNLFSRAGGEGDGFADIEPSLLLGRRPSLTFFTVEASAHIVTFANLTSQDSIDPALRVTYRYPNEDGVLPTSEMNLLVSKASVADPDVGSRVRETDLSANWEGTLWETAKTELQARLSAERLSYGEDDLNTNDVADAGLTLAFVFDEKSELGAGYDLSIGRSLPKIGDEETTRRLENELTFRGRGEFSPEISGHFFWGLAYVTYSGAQARSELAFVGGTNIVWAVSERRHLTVTADRRLYFSPEGDAAQASSIGLDFTQEIAGGFTATLGAQAVQTIYRQVVVFRRDNSFPLHAKLEYMIEPRFMAALDLSWSEQNSDWAFRNYHRTTLAGQFQYHF